MDVSKISWGNIEELEDYFITYLLYKEGKTVADIVKIRNISWEKVENDIIDAKIKIHASSIKIKEVNKSTLDRLLELPKNDRKDHINSLSSENKQKLLEEIQVRYNKIHNPDDKMLLIWIIGELKAAGLIRLVGRDIVHNNGNVRRMVCSALGKIQDPRSKQILHRALSDKKPQVRQYAGKALGDIGDNTTIMLLQRLLENKCEKDYVKRTCEEAILKIKNSLQLM